jgi:hypothetical protein
MAEALSGDQYCLFNIAVLISRYRPFFLCRINHQQHQRNITVAAATVCSKNIAHPLPDSRPQ